MCGIFGIVRPDDDITRDQLNLMRDSLRHRGPDHSGCYTEPGIAMGINRLAIVDLVSGNQPIFNEDSSLVIVYNGEVYNHTKLRRELEKRGHTFSTHSDTETVLHAFEEYGADCVKHFNGMFAFAIWNVRTKTLFIARDRLGIKPLYIAELNHGVAFASEAKALLHLMQGGAKPDWTAINRFFSYGYIPSPDSPFLGIKKFPQGHYAWIQETAVNKTCYWRPEYGNGENISLVETCSKLSGLLEQAVELELMSDVPVGIFLSGGLDSSAVALFAKKHSKNKPISFALRFEEATHDESAAARLVANYLGLDHHEFLFSKEVLYNSLTKVAQTLDEPFGDSTVLPLLILSEFAKNYVKVVLTGWGGDEIFAGYPTYKAHQIAHFYRKIPGILSERLIPAIIDRLPVSKKYMSFEFKAKRFLKGFDVSPELQHFFWMGYYNEQGKKHLFKKEIIEQINGETFDPVHNIVEALNETDLISRIMHLDAVFFLQGNGLFQADRMTMAASIEARVPLLNIDLLEYVNSIPIGLKMNGGKTKWLLKKVLENQLPKQILNKTKKGFGPPSAAWIRCVFSDVFDKLFSYDKVTQDGIFEYTEIERLLSEHRSQKANYGRELWALLSFQLWYDNFIKGSIT